MAALPPKHWTPEEYLAFERASDEKHEFVAGEIFKMTGASREHNLISLNIGSELRSQLRKRNCETYAADMRVRVRWRDYVYPDVVALCGNHSLQKATIFSIPHSSSKCCPHRPSSTIKA